MRGKSIHNIRRVSIAASILVLGTAVVVAAPTVESVTDLTGAAVNPLDGSEDAPRVLVFARTDCPISNRYAPEVQRLYERFTKDGVRFWLVYVDPEQPVDEVRKHLDEYSYTLPALRDPAHELVALTGVKVTPEAAVFDGDGKLVYRGRIDNRYVAFGKARQEATVHDLRQALEAVLDGRPVAEATTQGVGCYIEDLR
jgi:hypothetical protein